ncbi:hypothetical protein GGI07_002232 [Coemansia sp. Benny D115]|nr:hypothetical protein GGI07_002232 [Coemansia sp. Benny D115]
MSNALHTCTTSSPIKPMGSRIQRQPSYVAYYKRQIDLGQQLSNADYQRAMECYDLMASLQERSRQLSYLLHQFGQHKANPLGGAMCADLETRIHHLALLIRGQQLHLKQLVDEYNANLFPRSSSTRSRCSSLEEYWEEEVSSSPTRTLPGSSVIGSQDVPVVNWLATTRMAILKEVVDFTCVDLKDIESSLLFIMYPRPALDIVREAGPVPKIPAFSFM